MWGKIINEHLQVSGDVLYTETEQIFNATPEMWLANGWKPIYWDPIESAELDYREVLEETETAIIVHWESV